MKTLNNILLAYSLLIFMGGVFGYFVAGSLASILMSSLCANLYLTNYYFSKRNPKIGFYFSGILTFALMIFFLIRFFKTQTFMPSGLMTFTSFSVFVYHIFVREKLMTKDLKA